MNYYWDKEKQDWIEQVIYNITVCNTKNHKRISYCFHNFDEFSKFKYMLENLIIYKVCENIKIECYKKEIEL